MLRVITVTERGSPEADPRPTAMLIAAARQRTVTTAAIRSPLGDFSVRTVTLPIVCPGFASPVSLGAPHEEHFRALVMQIEGSPRGRLLRFNYSSGIERPKFATVIISGSGPPRRAGVQSVDRSELLGGELEVEHVDVFGDPVRLGRLRDHRAALLQVPAQHDLSGSLVVGLGDI